MAAATPSLPLGGRVGVVIAHPDDESMFFAPTLTAVKSRGERAFVLCLSSGDFYGLGETRKRELVKACAVLGVNQDDVIIIEHPELQDGSSTPWPTEVVASHVRDFVIKCGIDTLFTFDDRGVSGHSDHTAVSRGVALHLRIRNNSTGDSTPLEAFALVSTGMLRKYSGLLDLPWSFATSLPPPWGAVFVSFNMRTAWRAMAAHRSQFVWYRRLFVVFSRYAYVNTFDRLCAATR